MLIFTLASGFDRKELRTAMTVMQDAALLSPYIVVSGILISALSSALGSLFGGSRVLQAIARDNLFPGLSYFSKGTTNGDEPRRAVFLTWIIAQCCVLVGDLDVLAPVITSFFLISYALCNLTAFYLSVTGAPNFRPSFRYFSWHLSLLGFLLCFGVMFYLNSLNAVIALVLLISITIFLWFRHPATNWGDVSQALMYHQVCIHEIHTYWWALYFFQWLLTKHILTRSFIVGSEIFAASRCRCSRAQQILETIHIAVCG